MTFGDYLRGDVYMVDMAAKYNIEPEELRPCVIISQTLINLSRRTIVVVPTSSVMKAAPPLVIDNKASWGSEHPNVIMCDQLRAISRNRIRDRIGALLAEDLKALERALRFILNIKGL